MGLRREAPEERMLYEVKGEGEEKRVSSPFLEEHHDKRAEDIGSDGELGSPTHEVTLLALLSASAGERKRHCRNLEEFAQAIGLGSEHL